MTIKAGQWPAFIVWYYFGFILVDYQTGLEEKYIVTGDWSQSMIAETLPSVSSHVKHN